MLIYVCGKGGTGKFQIVKALIAVLTLLNRHHEIMVTASTLTRMSKQDAIFGINLHKSSY
jgi:CO dehydrogenase nickel-insertion accessory protein CooC1